MVACEGSLPTRRDTTTFLAGPECRKHTLPHARKEAVQCWRVLTHNAYIITHSA
jgi:hypothetical protein